MGNCLKANRIGVYEETHGSEAEVEPKAEIEEMDPMRLPTSSTTSEAKRQVKGGKKKVVRFKLVEEIDSHKAEGGGGVRYKIMVTQQELNQILSYNKDSKYNSIEQLLVAMKVSSRRIIEVKTGDREAGRRWRPTLESILEDH